MTNSVDNNKVTPIREKSAPLNKYMISFEVFLASDGMVWFRINDYRKKEYSDWKEDKYYWELVK